MSSSVDEARAGDVHRFVLPVAADVKEHEVGIVEVLGEPGGADEHLVALGRRAWPEQREHRSYGE